MQFSISSASTYAKQIVNAVLTFCFGFQFAATLLPDIPAAIAPFAAGLLYLATFDGGALGWNAKAEEESKSEKQYRVADGMATLCTFASTIISAAHILLSLKLFQSEGVQVVAGAIATIATVVVIGLHFIMLRIYRLNDPDRQEQQILSMVAAKVRAAKLDHMRNVQVTAITKVQELAGEHVEELAGMQARNMVQDFRATARRNRSKAKTTKKKSGNGRGRRKMNRKTRKAEVEHAAKEESYVEYEEIVDEAAANQATNLNMAGA